MKVLFSGGGTVGHISPQIAILEELKRRDENAKFLFILRKDGKENEEIKKAGYKIEEIEIYGLKRSLSFANIKRLYYFILSIVFFKKVW